MSFFVDSDVVCYYYEYDAKQGMNDIVILLKMSNIDCLL